MKIEEIDTCLVNCFLKINHKAGYKSFQICTKMLIACFAKLACVIFWNVLIVYEGLKQRTIIKSLTRRWSRAQNIQLHSRSVCKWRHSSAIADWTIQESNAIVLSCPPPQQQIPTPVAGGQCCYEEKESIVWTPDCHTPDLHYCALSIEMQSSSVCHPQSAPHTDSLFIQGLCPHFGKVCKNISAATYIGSKSAKQK